MDLLQGQRISLLSFINLIEQTNWRARAERPLPRTSGARGKRSNFFVSRSTCACAFACACSCSCLCSYSCCPHTRSATQQMTPRCVGEVRVKQSFAGGPNLHSSESATGAGSASNQSSFSSSPLSGVRGAKSRDKSRCEMIHSAAREGHSGRAHAQWAPAEAVSLSSGRHRVRGNCGGSMNYSAHKLLSLVSSFVANANRGHLRAAHSNSRRDKT